jgi:hypothetical protein
VLDRMANRIMNTADAYHAPARRLKWSQR